MNANQKLADLGLKLTAPAAPAANYVSTRRVGNIVYVSGQISAGPDGLISGHLGKELDVAGGQQAAQVCALNILSHVVHSAEVPLDSIKSIAKITVLVASTSMFSEQHLVANGASDLLVAVLGEAGRHARAAFGVAALPLGAAVEIDAIIEVA